MSNLVTIAGVPININPYVPPGEIYAINLDGHQVIVANSLADAEELVKQINLTLWRNAGCPLDFPSKPE